MAMSERIANEGAGTEAFSSTICRWLRVYESVSQYLSGVALYDYVRTMCHSSDK
jgi:hypothetical protein